VDTGDFLFLGIVVGAALVFMVTLGWVSWQTERSLKQREGGNTQTVSRPARSEVRKQELSLPHYS
jgi:hypothetical protein